MQVSFFLLLEKSQLKWNVIALQWHTDLLPDPAPDLPVQLQVPPEELPALVQGGGSVPFGQVNIQLTNTDEKHRTGACSLQQARRKTLEQYTSEDKTGTYFHSLLSLFTSLKLAFLVLQNFVSLNSPSLFCFRNVLVKTETPVGLPWALLLLIGKKKTSHDLSIHSV